MDNVKNIYTDDNFLISYDPEDIQEGKENEFEKAILDLHEYFMTEFEQEDSDIENDYYLLSNEMYSDQISYENILWKMEELNSYCRDCNIEILEFLDDMDDCFNTCDNYFLHDRKFISTNSLSNVNISYMDIIRAIAFTPKRLKGIENGSKWLEKIDTDDLRSILERIVNCVN